ncbi:response regulator transcription factor [Eleftheria terrae]|uniref:response regulator transcription factor n=1 Tax=Eleftheria terrae TaxID=1597781 RepID=UPI00263B637E|nr:response regulator transcription factor [Eleftheria terrae]WKB54433.1 response regulator transcription factor [Eleftheria terrae]
MKLRVLVIEDDPSLRLAFIEAVATTTDMEVVGHAGNLAEGARLLLSTRPDVLLVDLGLPDGNGVHLIEQAARSLPDCDVMVVTVFGDERHVLASIEAGATGYLLKDAEAAEIVEQIRVLKAGGSPISAVIARQLLRRFAGWTPPPAAAPAPRSADTAAGDHLLSPREREVLTLSSKGYSFDEIATMLALSRHTVTSFVKRIYRKLQVHSKTEAVYEARHLGLLDD